MKVGDKVRVKSVGVRGDNGLGVVTSINGFYVYVELESGIVVERYSGELVVLKGK